MANKEQNHYRKVIYDMVDSTELFNNLVKEVSAVIKNKDCITRLKSRQESYSFFLIIRVFRSNLNFKELKEILIKLKENNAYPIKYFVKKDHNGAKYHLLSFIFNNKASLYLTFNVFRLLRRKKI